MASAVSDVLTMLKNLNTFELEGAAELAAILLYILNFTLLWQEYYISGPCIAPFLV